MKKIDWLIFSIFLLLTFLLRFSSLFQSFIEWDEGLYLLVARSLIDGHPPYTVVWDNKPPGIYLLFSLALVLLGNSVFSIRILTCITIAITCYFLYRLGTVIGNNERKIGLLAGILYLIYSIQTDGLGGNTEIFFTPFVTLAFYLLFAEKTNPEKYTNPKTPTLFTIGLLFGIGLQIKQVVIFDFIAILIILFLRLYFPFSRGRRYLLKTLVRLCIPLFTGLFIPLLLIIFYFKITNHLSDYVYANFSANLVRVGGVGFSISFFLKIFKEQIIRNFLLWLCLFLIPFYLLLVKTKEIKEKKNLMYLIIWLFMALISICLLKGVYHHYYLQLLPPLCLISSYLIIRTVWMLEKSDKRKFLVLDLILIQPFFINTSHYIIQNTKIAYFQFLKGMNVWEDDMALIAKYLKERISKDDYIFLVDVPPTLYFLVDAKIPTKYAFSYFLVDKKFQTFAGVNPLQELDSIMSKKPTYVIRSAVTPRPSPTDYPDEVFYAVVDSYLQKSYIFEKQIKDVKVYKLRDKSSNKAFITQFKILQR